MVASDQGCKYRPEGHGEPDMKQPEAPILQHDFERRMRHRARFPRGSAAIRLDSAHEQARRSRGRPAQSDHHLLPTLAIRGGALSSALAMALLAIAQIMLLRRLQSRVTDNLHAANRISPVQIQVIVAWARRSDPPVNPTACDVSCSCNGSRGDRKRNRPPGPYAIRYSFAVPRRPGGTNSAVVRG